MDLHPPADERLRDLLAHKLAAITHGLPDEAQSRVRQQAYEALTRLVSEEVERVRAAIAHVVKDLPDVPRGLILALARDSSVTVAEPVILFSPLLTSEDLLALVSAAPSPGTVTAVARRPGIGEAVSDAVVASADADAIAALLDNPSAQIREAALDALAAAAHEHVDWQAPLVRRPVLPPRAAQALSEIVSSHLLAILAARPDLDRTLASRLAARLTSGSVQPDGPGPGAEAMAEVRRLSRAGLLTEQTLLGAVRRGDATMAAALLAVAAEVPIEIVERAATLRNAKGLISLVWQAGFSMRAGAAVQGLLGLVPPAEILAASAGGGFPLSVEELQWQMSFLSSTSQS
jgi:uncharacterized protein (DUF2336 family)